MRYPNKVIPYSQSVIQPFPELLSIVRKEPISPKELYDIMQKAFVDVGDFVEVLDCLFSMGYIEYNRQTGRLQYVV